MKLKLVLFGLLTWIVPFVLASCLMPFMELTSPLFKSLMVVCGSFTGMLFSILYFKKIEDNYLNEAIIVGVVWFVINLALDLLVLVIILKTPLVNYLLDVGLRYLTIPIMAIGSGILLKNKK